MSNYMHPYMVIRHLPTDASTQARLKKYIYEDHDNDINYAFAAGFTVNDGGYHFDGVNDVNWSIAVNELLDLSREFPEALIRVHYSNGYVDDESCDYFQNGKMATYTPELVWPEFNPNDLMEVYLGGNA